MLTVLVTNTKGGCGKTTVATNLAAAFAASGFATVFADSDRQRSSLRWVERRPATLPAITAVDWVKQVKRIPKGTQRLVIDVPGALRRAQVKALVGRSDIVVAPLLPSVFDEETTRRFLKNLGKIKSVRKSKRALAIVGNRIRSRTRSARRLDVFLDGLGLTSVTRLRETQFYPTAALGGLSIFDLGLHRADDFKLDRRPLMAFIDEVSQRVDA